MQTRGRVSHRVHKPFPLTGPTLGTDKVTVHSDGGDVVSRYVVGCDGAHSVVRAAIGVGFPGRNATTMLRLGDVRFPDATPIDGRPDLSVLADAHGLWIDCGGGERYRPVIDGVARLRRVEAGADLGVDAILVRSDGHVAWAGGGEDALRRALSMWFMRPATM